MTYAISDMSSYDDTGKVQKSAYIMEAGDYKIYVGNSIKDAGEHGVRYTYKVEDTEVTEQLSQQCAPVQLKKRLLANNTYEDLKTNSDEMNPHYTVPAEGTTKVEAENFLNSSGNLSVETFYDDNLQMKNVWHF